jgi:hypothetical protein
MEVLIVIAVGIGALYALRAPRDLERMGATVDAPERQVGAMGGTCAFMSVTVFMFIAGLLVLLWLAAAVIQ